MIYFDQAATSLYKPACVTDAFLDYLNRVGANPGRGCYDSAVQAGRMLYSVRKKVSAFFGAPDAANTVFAKNSTEALNLFLNGFLAPGGHVLISPYEHNAVLRPLEALRQQSRITYSVIPPELLRCPEKGLVSMLQPDTRLICCMLASNVTGQLVFSGEISAFAHAHGIPVLVDASQGASYKLIDMSTDGIDFLAFTGHKDLLGLPGTGGLVSLSPLNIPPLLQGGIGTLGESYLTPQLSPEGYEAGTVNMPALWALGAAFDYVQEHLTVHRRILSELTEQLLSGLDRIEHIRVYNRSLPRVSTVCFTAETFTPNEIAEKLNEQGICVRSGLHCAIKAHETLRTAQTGTVRVSLGPFHTASEVERFLAVLRIIVSSNK